MPNPPSPLSPSPDTWLPGAVPQHPSPPPPIPISVGRDLMAGPLAPPPRSHCPIPPQVSLLQKKPLRPETSEGREQGKAWVRVLATPTILFPWSFSSRSSTFPSSSSPSPALVSHPHPEPGPACLCALSRPLTVPSSGTSGSNVAFDSVLRPPPHPQVSSVTLPEFCPIPPSIPHLPIPPSLLCYHLPFLSFPLPILLLIF